jgi:hypothetical protein
MARVDPHARQQCGRNDLYGIPVLFFGVRANSRRQQCVFPRRPVLSLCGVASSPHSQENPNNRLRGFPFTSGAAKLTGQIFFEVVAVACEPVQPCYTARTFSSIGIAGNLIEVSWHVNQHARFYRWRTQ